MERKPNRNRDINTVTVGIVGHCPVETLQEIKRLLDSLSYFRLVFFTASSGKLWIKEGGDNDQ